MKLMLLDSEQDSATSNYPAYSARDRGTIRPLARRRIGHLLESPTQRELRTWNFVSTV